MPWAIAAALAAPLAGAHDAHAAPAAAPADIAQLFAGIPQQGNILGDPAAPVTLTEFSDLRCSHCRNFEDITMPVLLDRYVRSGRVRVVFENLPILGPSSNAAARMAAAIGLQGHEFEFIDAYFHGSGGAATDDVLRRIASQIPGVDVDLAMQKRMDPAVTSQIEEARNMAEEFSVAGTPTFLLGKTGTKPHVLPLARATKPDTITGPIDDMLAQHP